MSIDLPELQGTQRDCVLAAPIRQDVYRRCVTFVREYADRTTVAEINRAPNAAEMREALDYCWAALRCVEKERSAACWLSWRDRSPQQVLGLDLDTLVATGHRVGVDAAPAEGDPTR